MRQDTPKCGAPKCGESAEFDDRGYILVVLLVGMAVAAVWMGAALPAWRQQAMREREADLIFRGEQYARAIALYQHRTGAYPPTIDILVSQKYLRKKWKDPITRQDFALVTGGSAGTAPTSPGQTGGRTGAPSTSSQVPTVRGTPTGGQSGAVTPIQGTTPGQGTPGRGTSQGATPGTIGSPTQVAGITGVRSTSSAASIRIYYGQTQYNAWQFDAAMMQARMGRVQPGETGRGRGDGRGGTTPGRGGSAPGVSIGSPSRGGRMSPAPGGRGGPVAPPPIGAPGRGAGS